MTNNMSNICSLMEELKYDNFDYSSEEKEQLIRENTI